MSGLWRNADGQLIRESGGLIRCDDCPCGCEGFMDTYSIDSYSYLKTSYTGAGCGTSIGTVYYRIAPASLPLTLTRVTMPDGCEWRTSSVTIQASNDGTLWLPYTTDTFTMIQTVAGWQITSSFWRPELDQANATPVGTFSYNLPCTDISGTYTTIVQSMGVS